MVPVQSSHGTVEPVSAGADRPGYLSVPELVVYDEVSELISVPMAPPHGPALARPAAPPITSSLAPPYPTEPARMPDVAGRSPIEFTTAPTQSAPPLSVGPRTQPLVHASEGRAVRAEDSLLLVSRRAVYAQAILLAGVATGALLAGYLIGRSRGPAAEGEAANDPVVVQGHVVYSPSSGQREPDEDAVVIALPRGEVPSFRFATIGLRPQDTVPRDNIPAVDIIEDFGGAYARTDADGEFQLVVPRPGSYHLLIVSRHTARPRGAQPEPGHLTELAGFFQSAPELIGDRKYAWLVRKFAGTPAPMTHEFGVDGA